MPDRQVSVDDFASLYRRVRPDLVGQARRYLNDARDIDEVVQETSLRLFVAITELSTELQALAFARRVLTNLCIDRYRQAGRRPALISLDHMATTEIPNDDPGTDRLLRDEDASVVRQAILQLNPEHRAALIKREVEEKPLPVIAQELGVPVDSVKHLLFRARRALRRELSGSTVEPGVDSDRRV